MIRNFRSGSGGGEQSSLEPAYADNFSIVSARTTPAPAG